MRKAALVLFGALVLLMVAARPGLCADLAGLVVDSANHPVAHVKIVVGSMTGKVLSETETGVEGRYQITGLAPGTYKYAVEPLASRFKGGNAVAYLGSRGLTINWRLSATAAAIASAAEGAEVAIADDPFGFSPLTFGALVAGGVAALAGGVVGGYAAAGGFSGPPASPSL
jgi:hypothetical protein